jgi:hypothetical protein
MPVQAVWVHGNTIKPEDTRSLIDVPGIRYSAIVGYPRGAGITFRGADGGDCIFHASIPTPTFRGPSLGVGRHCRLLRVAIKVYTDPGVRISQMKLYGGNTEFRMTHFRQVVGWAVNWEENRNYFAVDQVAEGNSMVYPIVYDAVNVALHVNFDDEGIVSLFSVGADFDVGG